MICPFCGVETGVAHETQQGCIDALRSEILRVRDILHTVRPLDAPDAPEASEIPSHAPEDNEVEPLF